MIGSLFHRLQRVAPAIAISTLVVSLAGCSKTPYVWAGDLPPERAKPAAERLTFEAGDAVVLTVSGQAPLSGSHVVGIDGTIAIPNVGAVNVGGLTVERAEQTVTQSISKIIAEPKVAIVVVSRSIDVTILGEVSRQGKYKLKAGDGVPNALALAGGVTEFGNKNAVYLVRSNEPLRIRFRMKDLLQGGNSATAFALRDGDLIVVE